MKIKNPKYYIGNIMAKTKTTINEVGIDGASVIEGETNTLILKRNAILYETKNKMLVDIDSIKPYEKGKSENDEKMLVHQLKLIPR